jgi:hypothetical protein
MLYDSNPFLFEISDLESSPTLAPPQFLLDAAPMVVDDSEDMDFELHSHHDSGFSSPLIIPSSPQAGPQDQLPSSEHQQTPGNEKSLKRVYHDKLNGRFNIILFFI